MPVKINRTQSRGGWQVLQMWCRSPRKGEMEGWTIGRESLVLEKIPVRLVGSPEQRWLTEETHAG